GRFSDFLCYGIHVAIQGVAVVHADLVSAVVQKDRKTGAFLDLREPSAGRMGFECSNPAAGESVVHTRRMQGAQPRGCARLSKLEAMTYSRRRSSPFARVRDLLVKLDQGGINSKPLDLGVRPIIAPPVRIPFR